MIASLYAVPIVSRLYDATRGVLHSDAEEASVCNHIKISWPYVLHSCSPYWLLLGVPFTEKAMEF